MKKNTKKTKNQGKAAFHIKRLIVAMFSIIVVLLLCTSVFTGLCETNNEKRSRNTGTVVHPGLYTQYYTVTGNYSSPTYNDTVYKAWQVSPNIDFNWGTGSPPDTYLGDDHFFVRWQGYLKVEEKDTYILYVDHDNGCRIWFNNILIIDNWTNTATRNWSIETINAGYNPLKVEFFENTGSASIVLSWVKMSEHDANVSFEDMPENPIPPECFRQDQYLYWYQTCETADLSSTTTENIGNETIKTYTAGNATYYNTTHYSNSPMDNIPHTTTVHSSSCLKTWTAPGVPVNEKIWLFFTFYLTTNTSSNQPEPDNQTVFLGDMNVNMWFNGYKYNTSEYLSMYGSEEDEWIPSLHAEPYTSETITFNIEDKRKNGDITLIGYNSLHHSCAYGYYGTISNLFSLSADDKESVTATQIMVTAAPVFSLTSYNNQPIVILEWYGSTSIETSRMLDIGFYLGGLKNYRSFLKIYIPPSAACSRSLSINISHPSPYKLLSLGVKRNSFPSGTPDYMIYNSNISVEIDEINLAGWYYIVFNGAIQKNMTNESFTITTRVDSDNPHLEDLNDYNSLIPYLSDTYMCNLTRTTQVVHTLNHTSLTEKYCIWNNHTYSDWTEYNRTKVEITKDITVHTARYQSKYDINMNFMEQISYPQELVNKTKPGNGDLMFFYDGTQKMSPNIDNSINILKDYNVGVTIGPFPPNGESVMQSDQGYLRNVWVDLLMSPTINGRYNWVYSNTSSYWGTDKIIRLVYYDKILPFGMGNNTVQYMEYPDNFSSVTQDGCINIYDRETSSLLLHSSITGGFYPGGSASAGWLAKVMREYPNVSDIKIVYNTTVSFSFSVKHPGENVYTVANNSPDMLNISVSKNYTIYHGERTDNIRLVLKHDVDVTTFASMQPALEKLKISIPEEGLIEHGLIAEYYNYDWSNYSEYPNEDTIFDNPVTATRIEPNINTTFPSGSLPGNVTSDYFAVRWEGYLRIPAYDNYIIYTDSDDGVRVWVDNHLIIDDWYHHDTTQNCGWLDQLQPGYYHIVVEYFEKTGNADMVLSWCKTACWYDKTYWPKTVIAPEYLHHTQHYENGILGTAGYVPAYPYLGFIYNVETPLSTKTYNMSSILSHFYNDTDNNQTHIIIGNRTYYGYWDPPLNNTVINITDKPNYSLYPGNPQGNKTYLPFITYYNMTTFSGSKIYPTASFCFYTITLRRVLSPYPVYQYGLYGVPDSSIQDMMQDQTITLSIEGTNYDVVRTPMQRNLVIPICVTPLTQTFSIQTLFYYDADYQNTSTVTIIGLTNKWTPTISRINMNNQSSWTTEEINNTWADKQMLAVTPYHSYLQISTDKNTYEEKQKIVVNIHLHVGPNQTTPGQIDGHTLNKNRMVTVTLPYYDIITDPDGNKKYSFNSIKTLTYITDSNGDIHIDDEHIRANPQGTQITASMCMGMEDDELYISSAYQTKHINVIPEWMQALIYVAIFCFIAFIAWGICRYYSKWYHGERENMGGET